jgi:DNA-binding CsgD family transcriptional regulator
LLAPRYQAVGGMDAAQELIGRHEELSLLVRFLESFAAGPRALLLEGEAGIGKTALWQAGLAHARARGQRTLGCRPAGSEVRLSFAALGDLLAGALEEALADLPVPQRRALQVALLLVEPEGEPPDQRAIGLAVLNVLRTLSSASPVLVAIDDAQWLDAPSAAVLAFALRRLGAEPVGVLATVRLTGGEPPGVAFEPWLPAERLCLGPLNLAAVHELLRTRLGLSPSRPTLVRLHQAAGGNPFFALELGRALSEQGHEPALDEPLPVPAGLRALVRARLARLPAPARQSLLAVAALSRPTVALAVAAAGQEERTVADLERATHADVVAYEDDRIRFTHPLLASTLYAEAPLGQRRQLHGRLAELVSDGEERARHLALAADGPDLGVAAALEEAATHAHLRGAPDAAAGLCEQACALTPEDRPEEMRRRAMDAAGYHLLAGNTSRARVLLEEAVGCVAPGRERARLLQRLGQVHYHEDSWATAEEVLSQALAEAGDHPLLRCEIEQGLSFARQVRGDIPAAAVRARAALELAEQAADRRLVSESLVLVSLYEFFLGHGIRGDLMERAATLEEPTAAAQPGRPAQLLSRRLVWAAMLKWADQFDEARSSFEEVHRQMLERGDEGSLAFLLSNLSELECWAGNWELAAQYAAEGARLATLTGQGTMVSANLYAKALVEAHRGLVDSARAAAEEALAHATASGNASVALMSLSALGFLEVSLGHPADAHAHLRPIREGLAAVGLGEPGVLRFVPDQIQALIELGELEQARALVDALEERGRALDRAWALATGARSRALLLAAEGDLAGAHAALERALEAHERLAQPFEFGRTLLALGTVQRRQGEKRAARETLEQALSIFDQLGARLWADKTRGELRRIGGRTASSGQLSETEARIVALVCAGQTNEQVARALSLSAKTVAWNLSKVYRKLGVRSRTELAARWQPSNRR